MKKRNYVLSILGMIAMVLAACSTTANPSSSSSTTSQGNADTFTYAISSNPTATNPIVTSDRWGLTVANMMYSPLVRVDGDGNQENELAESVNVSEDGMTITVTLRKDVKWSDGEPFTADDVVFTYETRANKANGNYSKLWLNDQQIGIKKVDDYTVQFLLPTASAAAVNNIVTEMYIIPEHAYKNIADFSVNDLDVSPVGTGPYQLKEYKRGEYLSFVANEHYYKGTPSIQNVVLRVITSADTTRLALQTGEVDAAFVLPAEVSDLNTATIATYAYSENRVGYMGLNTATEELQDVRVRQAILYALNKNDMNMAAYISEEYYTNVYSILPPGNPFATSNVEKYEQNLEKARALLSEAGVSDLRLKLGYNASDAAQAVQATFIQQQLQQIGVTVELAGGDSTALFTELRKAGSTAYHLFLGGYIMGNDPDQYTPLFKSGARANYFQYKSAKTDELFATGAVELNAEKRKEIYVQLQQQIASDAIIYPIVDNKKILAVNKRIKNVEKAGLVSIYTFEDMSKLTIE